MSAIVIVPASRSWINTWAGDESVINNTNAADMQHLDCISIMYDTPFRGQGQFIYSINFRHEGDSILKSFAGGTGSPVFLFIVKREIFPEF